MVCPDRDQPDREAPKKDTHGNQETIKIPEWTREASSARFRPFSSRILDCDAQRAQYDNGRRDVGIGVVTSLSSEALHVSRLLLAGMLREYSTR